jgi:acetyl esterase/lipase
MDHEGHEVARWLTSRGIAGFIVKYRLGPRYHHPAMLQDALRAVRLVRSRAAEFNIKPDRVGVMGFSAGGHLASSAATLFDLPEAKAADGLESVSSRPDFAVLAYPVILMGQEKAHKGSQDNLLGENPPAALVSRLSTEQQVTSRTPPTFLFQTDEDTGVPAENAVKFYLALRKAGVPAELHIYQKGVHGVGLDPADREVSTWPDRLLGWLRVNGLIPQ